MEFNSCVFCGLQGKWAKIYQKNLHILKAYIYSPWSLFVTEKAKVSHCNYFVTWLEMLTLKPNEIGRECILHSVSGEIKNITNDKKADTNASCI